MLALRKKDLCKYLFKHLLALWANRCFFVIDTFSTSTIYVKNDTVYENPK